MVSENLKKAVWLWDNVTWETKPYKLKTLRNIVTLIIPIEKLPMLGFEKISQFTSFDLKNQSQVMYY